MIKCEAMLLVFASPDLWAIVNAIAGTVSALAAFATVLIAVSAFRQARRDKQSDDESRHPDFSMTGSIRAIEQDDSHRLELVFQNRGENPAIDITARVLLIGPPYDGKDNYHFVKDIVGTIHKISSFAIQENLKLKQEAAQHFLAVELKYRDGRTGKDVPQFIYQKCTGFKALTEAYFEEISSDELELIKGQTPRVLGSKESVLRGKQRHSTQTR